MRKKEIEIGKTYLAKVSGKLTAVRLTGNSPYKGYDGLNLKTGRTVRIKTAAKLRKEFTEEAISLGKKMGAIRY